MRALPVVLLLLAAPAFAQAPALPAVDPSTQSATPQNATPAPAQAPNQPQQTGGRPGGDASVQSAAPEVGAGRGDAGGNASGANAPQPTNPEQHPTSPAPATGDAAPRPRQSTPAPIPFGPPLALQSPVQAGDVERLGQLEGRVSIPNQAAGLLIQPEGRDWRVWRTRWLTIGGLVVLCLTVAALLAWHLLHGPTRIAGGRSGRRVTRFTLLERTSHWMVAISFVVLALTGLNITYGAYALRPVIGAPAFTAATWWGQAIHQGAAFAFMLGVLVMLVHWGRENLIRRVDVEWIKAGGMLSKHPPTAGKFNAGQKALYWLSMLGGVLLSVTGILLMMPGLLDDISAQQWAHVAHGLVAMGMIALILGHAYLGTAGTEGAFEGMRDGDVDFNWAREHHGRWLDEEVQRARTVVANDAAGQKAGAD
ncbi:formate dehydrogenase subunit gamma [Falsiroseomonas sp. HW251]|uniref:formate dehydrogenase subunit gamma n=1 Tax=Falsiroseomonas sp. HW251 TaxID=3390998 RepID=UPI003D3182EB